MIRMLLLAAVLLPALASQGQSPLQALPGYDRGFLFLKNGSVLKGRYLLSDDMKRIRLESGRNTWVFDMEEVERISSVRPRAVLTPEKGGVMAPVPDPVWYNLTEVGILAGNRDNSQPAPLVFNASLYRRLGGKLSAGGGLGVEFMKETYLPLTANLLCKMRPAGLTPFVMLAAGYQLPLEGSRSSYYEVVPEGVRTKYIDWWYVQPTAQPLKARGGFLFSPSFGILKQSWQGMGLSLSFGYRFHRLNYKASDDYRLNVGYNRLSLKLGMVIY